MRRGDFLSAWEVSDQVLTERVAAGPCWHLPRHEQWIWDGRPLAGQRVLVRCYHGLGDTIQFARFLPLLDSMAREVIVWAPACLLPLLRTLGTRALMLPLHDGTPEVDYDVDVEIMELPHALRITLDTLPRSVPYFHVAPAGRLSSRCSVGLVALSGEWDASRSVDGEALVQAVAREGVDVFSLQLQPLGGVADLSAPDVLELASRISVLDLVISVDTMVAHLAGALGVPTWTLLKFDADWRWLEQRQDSPWYPTMRLFRQPRPGDWAAVLEQVQAAL
jgi:hypothetical protein